MKKALLATAAAIPAIVMITAPAKAFVPIVLAGIVAGSVLFGAVTGHTLLTMNQTPAPQAYVAPGADYSAPPCVLKRDAYGRLIRAC